MASMLTLEFINVLAFNVSHVAPSVLYSFTMIVDKQEYLLSIPSTTDQAYFLDN